MRHRLSLDGLSDGECLVLLYIGGTVLMVAVGVMAMQFLEWVGA